jgi:hypothetical protein
MALSNAVVGLRITHSIRPFCTVHALVIRVACFGLKVQYLVLLVHSLRDGAESCWACQHPDQRLQKPARAIPSAMKNSPALRCGNAQSVTKVACS